MTKMLSKPIFSFMYIWFKSLHIIAMVTWFAGLFYMFRLFVYHTENKDDSSRVELLKIMSYRLYKYITTPGMVATWIFGLCTLSQASYLMSAHWFQLKFVLLLVLSGYHGFVGKTLKRYAANDVYLTSKQCRMLNEVPTLFLISIIILAVTKPF
ncbi:MAG: TIGR00701 family protein [Bdellovibrionaceae bacterium]|nr:TIGR00701 family protein [Pseudobdellovibrionaceae bacterium]